MKTSNSLSLSLVYTELAFPAVVPFVCLYYHSLMLLRKVKASR